MAGVRLKKLVECPVVKGLSGKLPYVALEHVESRAGRPVDGFEQETRDADDAVRFGPGDVLFGKLRPYLVKVLNPDYEGCASGEFLVLRPLGDLHPRFLYYLCLSRPFTGWADATSYGVKMPRTTWDAVGSFELEVPSPSEQRAIAGFLDLETARVDRILSARRRLLDLLDARSMSLSWIAITGANLPDGRRSSGLPWLGSVPDVWSVAAVSSQFEGSVGTDAQPRTRSGAQPGALLAECQHQVGFRGRS